jgi:hypothetical protein
MLHQQFLSSKYGLSAQAYKTETNPPMQNNKEVSALPPAVDINPLKAEKLQDGIISVNLVSKESKQQDYQDFIFFNLQYTASGLDKPARAIKKVAKIQRSVWRNEVGYTVDHR